jgi:hypothetical protein
MQRRKLSLDEPRGAYERTNRKHPTQPHTPQGFTLVRCVRWLCCAFSIPQSSPAHTLFAHSLSCAGGWVLVWETLPALHPTVEHPPLASVATVLKGSISGPPSASCVAPWHRYARFGAGIPSLGQWRHQPPGTGFMSAPQQPRCSPATSGGRFGGSLRSPALAPTW